MKFKKTIIGLTLSLSLVSGVTYAATTSSTKGADLEWAFTQADQKPEKLLIGVIDSAKSTLDIAIYSLTKPDIVDAIKKAKKRGVVVRLIMDRIQAAGKSQTEALKILGSAGVQIKVNKHSGLMHLKMTIADNKVATTGSFNYSENAATSNDEILMVIKNSIVAKSFTTEFNAIWNDTKASEAINPKIAQSNIIMPSTTTQTAPKAQGTTVVYNSCAEVKAAGKAPLKKGDAGYSTKLDRDGDGIACE